MSVKIIGMIGGTAPANDATVHIITGGISPDYLKSFAQAKNQRFRIYYNIGPWKVTATTNYNVIV